MGLILDFGAEIGSDSCSLVSNVKRVAEQLKQKTGSAGVDYLITTQGGPPNGKYSLTDEGHETHFAVQLLSRFGLAYLLADSGTLKDTWLTVCAPAGAKSSPPDVDDLELAQAKESNKYGIIASGTRDSAVTDGLVAHFSSVFPKLRAQHTFPGYVHTAAASNQGFPYPLVLLQRVFGPLLTYTPIGNTPTSYAEVPFYLVTIAEARGKRDQFQFTTQSLKSVGRPSWTTEQPDTLTKLWDSMKQKLGA